MENQDYIVIHAKRKTIRLTFRRDGTPIVYAPKRYPKYKIEEFVRRSLPRLQKKAEATRQRRTDGIFGAPDFPSLMYLGERYPITRTAGAFFSFSSKEFRVSASLDESGLINAYREFLRLRTQDIVPPLAREYAEKAGLYYNDITVKNVYSRFGSCSSKKNLNFTLALSAFDETFIRSVVTHELSHLVHMNHSPDFHNYHRSIFPEADKITLDTRRRYSSFLVALCSYKS